MIGFHRSTGFPLTQQQRDKLVKLVSHFAFSGKERLATISWLNSPNANYGDCELLIDKARIRIEFESF